ncbi:KilA-N domain-containing protein [Trichocoleus desertorum AS-A10]|uniref:KilA-N domain-containing protein n=1 Tax=Trichocoleus desertorum TaxID=1481672 RepID=UPI003298420F
MSIITREVNSTVIAQRVEDRYVNPTKMTKAEGKRIGHYLANESTKASLEALSSDIAYPISTLIQAKKGGVNVEQRIWGSPQVAIHYAQWRTLHQLLEPVEYCQRWVFHPLHLQPELNFAIPGGIPRRLFYFRQQVRIAGEWNEHGTVIGMEYQNRWWYSIELDPDTPHKFIEPVRHIFVGEVQPR